MKKIGILVIAFLLVFAINIFATNDTVKVLINDEYVIFSDQNGNIVNPEITNDRTMVPLRKIFEKIGAQIEWDDLTKTVTAIKDEKTVMLTIGSTQVYTIENGVKKEIVLDSKPYIVDGRTLVPLRFVSESFGASVGWDSDSKTAIIISYDEFNKELASKCTNLFKIQELSGKRENNFKSAINLKVSGEGDDAEEGLAEIKDNIKITVIFNNGNLYINFPEGIAAKDEEMNAEVEKTYILFKLGYIAEKLGIDENMDLNKFISENLSDDITLESYEQVKYAYKVIGDLLCDDNLKIVQNGNKTQYAWNVDNYKIASEDNNTIMTIDIDMKVNAENGIENSIYLKFKRAIDDDSQTLEFNGDIEYSKNEYTLPSDVNIEDIFQEIIDFNTSIINKANEVSKQIDEKAKY